jgi:hypothetical protein
MTSKRTMVAVGLAAVGGFATAALWMSHAGAQGIPTAPTLHYSGTVLDNGTPASGVKNITVQLWTAADAGTMVCERPRSTVAVVAGRFRVELPDTCLAAVRAQPNLWVQTLVESTAFPRTKLGAVPYAVEADRAAALAGAQAAQLVPTGAVMAFDLDQCPQGWSPLDKARGRTIVGVLATAAGGLSAHTRGQTGGAETVTLSEAQMPAHDHPLNDPGHVHPSAFSSFIQGGSPGEGPANIQQGGASFVFSRTTGGATTGVTMGKAGGGQPVAVMPPFLALLYCEKM